MLFKLFLITKGMLKITFKKPTKYILITIVFIMLLNFSSCIGSKENNTKGETIPSNLNSSQILLSEQPESKPERKIITLTDEKGNPMYDDWEVTGKGIHNVTKALSEKIKEYKGQDVYFKVDIFVSGMTKRANEKNASTKEEVYKYIEDLSGEKVSKLPHGQDFTEFYYNDMFIKANLTEGMIKKFIQTYFFVRIKFSDPIRPEGYSKKLADHMVNLLERMDDSEKTQVIIISAVENEVASANDGYEWLMYPDIYTEYKKEWPKEKELTNENIKIYLEEIINRNKINENVVEYLNKINGATIKNSAIKADLTKNEILKLVKDEDVKLIYPDNSIFKYNLDFFLNHEY